MSISMTPHMTGNVHSSCVTLAWWCDQCGPLCEAIPDLDMSTWPKTEVMSIGVYSRDTDIDAYVRDSADVERIGDMLQASAYAEDGI